MKKGLNYLLNFRQNCTSERKQIDIEGEDCAFEQMRQLGINWE